MFYFLTVGLDEIEKNVHFLIVDVFRNGSAGNLNLMYGKNCY